jgi:hypothetical protein
VNSRMAIFTKKGALYDTTGRVLYGAVPTILPLRIQAATLPRLSPAPNQGSSRPTRTESFPYRFPRTRRMDRPIIRWSTSRQRFRGGCRRGTARRGRVAAGSVTTDVATLSICVRWTISPASNFRVSV